MTTADITLLLLIGLSCFTVGWFLGRQRAQKMETLRRERRTHKIIGQMFTDLEDGIIEETLWQQNIDYLNQSLKEALANEDYEKAAQLRDLIKNQE
ncbi:MAG: hypothetical protein CMP57_01945 [Flavobacteriales bacterium]|nr:hypothetical protein [Flavobacteriales bacterium]|tara:strand:- start:9227 stop:9514 length:288 start_codon:yes stop_codon:yes gene_type:complete